jgi:hypothetical protein
MKITTDIWQSALFLLNGHQPAIVERISAKKCRIHFEESPQIDELELQYLTGKATVPILTYRANYEQIRQLMNAAPYSYDDII